MGKYYNRQKLNLIFNSTLCSLCWSGFIYLFLYEWPTLISIREPTLSPDTYNFMPEIRLRLIAHCQNTLLGK